MKLIADINIPFLQGALEPFFDVEYLPGNKISSSTIKNADALLVRTRTICNANLLQDSKIKFIGSATVGFDHIDTEYCNSKGIVWANAPGCNSRGVQQWVVAALDYWSGITGTSLNSLTIGIVGVGNVGIKVAETAKILGMNVLCCDPPRQRNEQRSDFVDLEYILKHSDIVTLHVPLNYEGADKTFHLLNLHHLSLCKPNVFIINTSRGEVIKTEDAVTFLSRNLQAKIALDVWENEPGISAGLLNKALIATPHIAGYSAEGKVLGTKAVVDSLSSFFNLGIQPWWPSPNPLSRIELNASNDILSAIKSTYNIMDDDLRNVNVDFENYRNTYPYRHDFTGYIVSKHIAIAKDLEKVGFSVSTE